MLCSWFPWAPSVLTLKLVETLRGGPLSFCRAALELATETKCGALMYDVSLFQKYKFYLIPITSKFSTKSARITQLLVLNLDVIGILESPGSIDY